METPVLVHVHLPKCAGTSIRTHLKRSFGSEHRNLYPGPHSFVYDEDRLWKEAISDPAVRSVSSHFIRRFPQFIRGRRVLYFTFLREPLQQFLSFQSYVRMVGCHIRDEELLASLPPDAHNLSSREFARWLLEQPFDIAFRENYATNFLARYVWMANTGRGPRDHSKWPQHWAVSDWDAYCTTRLAIAKNVLESFLFVGTVEQMAQGMDVLRERAAQWGFGLAPGVPPVENGSAEFRDDTSWVRPEDEVGQSLLRSLGSDFELYNFARNLAGLPNAYRTAVV